MKRSRFTQEQIIGILRQLGQGLDAIAEEANLLLIQANGSILNGDAEAAIAAITAIAERIFVIYPFMPDPMPQNWREILGAWLLGESIAAIAAGQESEILQFIERGLVYRLPWAMEAIRVRGVANGDTVDGLFSFEDYELGCAVAAIETGTLNRSAAILIQAGFNSRLGAIKAVMDSGANFQTANDLRHWLRSEDIAEWSIRPDWPTPETRPMWVEFAHSFPPRASQVWSEHRYWSGVTWIGVPPPPETPVQLHNWADQPFVLATDGEPLGTLHANPSPKRAGLIRAHVSHDPGSIGIVYFGPDDLIAP